MKDGKLEFSFGHNIKYKIEDIETEKANAIKQKNSNPYNQNEDGIWGYNAEKKNVIGHQHGNFLPSAPNIIL